MSSRAGSSRFEWLNSLKLPEVRNRSGRFLAEGVRFVDRAVARGAPLRSVVTHPALLHIIHGRKLARELEKRIETVTLSAEQFRDLRRQVGSRKRAFASSLGCANWRPRGWRRRCGNARLPRSVIAARPS